MVRTAISSSMIVPPTLVKMKAHAPTKLMIISAPVAQGGKEGIVPLTSMNVPATPVKMVASAVIWSTISSALV